MKCQSLFPEKITCIQFQILLSKNTEKKKIVNILNYIAFLYFSEKTRPAISFKPSA